jgi:hypothetical protein
METSWKNIHKAKILGRPIQPKNLASEILNKRISPHTLRHYGECYIMVSEVIKVR